MSKLILWGASDDLIQVDGFIREEFSVNCDQPFGVAVSDGTLLRVRYDEDGIWRFTPVIKGSTEFELEHGLDDRQHSDKVTLTGDGLTWVALTDQYLRKR